MFCWPFLILISFYSITVAFIPSLQKIGNFAGKAASSLKLIIQSPTTMHLISSLFLSAPVWREGTLPYYFLIWSPTMHSWCSSRLSPSSVNPAFHLVLRGLSAYGPLMISITCAATNKVSYMYTGESVSNLLSPNHHKGDRRLLWGTLLATTLNDRDLDELQYTAFVS